MSLIKKYYYKFYSLSDKKILISLFVLSFILRLIYCIYYDYKFAFTTFGDDLDYISFANNILIQGITVKDIDQIFGNAHLSGIGWPLILAGIFKIFGENYYVVYLLNIIFSSLQVVFVYLVAKEVFNKHVAIFSAIWSALYIKFIKYTPSILKENLLHLLFFVVIYLFIQQIKEKSIRTLIYLILVFSFLIHTDERYFAFFPLMLILYLYYFRKDLKTGLKLSGIFAGAVILLMIPWTIRNYEVYQKPVILTLRTAKFTDKILGYDETTAQAEGTGKSTSYIRKNLPVYEEITKQLVSTGQVDTIYSNNYAYIESMRMGIEAGKIPRTYSSVENIYANFAEFFRPFRFTGGYTANGYRYMTPWPLFNNGVVILQYGILLPFFIIGLYFFIASKNKYWLLITSFLLLYSFVHIVLAHSIERYRNPIDGLIFIIAFYGIYMIILKLRNKNAV